MSSQHSNHKRIAKNTMMLYVRQLFSMVVSLFTAGIVLRILGVDNYGIYNVVGGIVALFSFLQGSMASGTQRFMNFEMGKGDYKRLQKVFSTSITIHIAVAVAIFILAETVGLWFVNYKLVISTDRMIAANWVYQFSVFSAILSITQTPYTAAIIANEKMSVYGYLGIAETLMRLLVLYLLVTVKMDKLILYALLVFVVGSMFVMTYRIYCLKKFPECHFSKPDDKSLYKEMLGFSGWNLFGALASVGINQGLDVLLNIFFGTVVNAARAIALNVNSIVNQFVGNFMVALNPQITQSYAAGELRQANNLVFRGAKFSYFMLFILASPILIKTQEVLTLWLKTPPEYAALFCRLALIDTLIITVSIPIMAGVAATGKINRYQAVVGGVLLLNVPISYLLLKLGLPPVTVYLVAISISLTAFFVRVFMSDRLLHFGKMRFVHSIFLRCWLMFIIAIPVEYYIAHLLPNSTLFVFVVMMIAAVISTITVFLIGMTKSERHFILSMVSSKLKFTER